MLYEGQWIEHEHKHVECCMREKKMRIEIFFILFWAETALHTAVAAYTAEIRHPMIPKREREK